MNITRRSEFVETIESTLHEAYKQAASRRWPRDSQKFGPSFPEYRLTGIRPLKTKEFTCLALDLFPASPAPLYFRVSATRSSISKESPDYITNFGVHLTGPIFQCHRGGRVRSTTIVTIAPGFTLTASTTFSRLWLSVTGVQSVLFEAFTDSHDVATESTKCSRATHSPSTDQRRVPHGSCFSIRNLAE